MVDVEGKILAATKGIAERLISSNRLVLAKQHLVLPDVALQTLYDFGIDPREVLATSPEFENFPIQVRRLEDGRTIDYRVAGYRLGVVGLKAANIADPGIYSLRRHMLYLTSQGFVFDPLDEGEKPPIYEATMVTGTIEKLVEEGNLVFLAPERKGTVRNILEHWAAPCSPMCFYEWGKSEDMGICCTKYSGGDPCEVPEVSCEPFFHLQARAFLAAALSALERKAGMEAVDQFLYRLYVLLVHAPIQGILYPELSGISEQQADRTPAYAQTIRLLFPGDYERLVSLVEQSRGLELREGRALFPVPDAQLLSTREFFLMHPFFTALGKIIADEEFNDGATNTSSKVMERFRGIAGLIAQAVHVPVESLGLNLEKGRETDRMKLQELLIEHAPALRASPAFAQFDEKRRVHYASLVERECIPIRELLSRREDVVALLGRPDPDMERAREKADGMEETRRMREMARMATARLLPIETAQTRD
jgi:hypothetical protein